MKDIFLFYFFSSLLPQLSNSYSRKPKDKKTLALLINLHPLQWTGLIITQEWFFAMCHKLYRLNTLILLSLKKYIWKINLFLLKGTKSDE